MLYTVVDFRLCMTNAIKHNEEMEHLQVIVVENVLILSKFGGVAA